MADKTCTIQTYTETENDINEEIKTWADKEDHIDLDCFLGNVRGAEVSQKDRTIHTTFKRAVLLGAYPLILASERAVIDDITYEIIAVSFDLEDNITALDLERMTL